MSIYTMSLSQDFTLTNHITVVEVETRDNLTMYSIESPVLPEDLSIIRLPRDHDGLAIISAAIRNIFKAEERLRIKSN